MHKLQEMIVKQKSGEHTGIFSCCSSNEYVLRSLFKKAKEHNIIALVESTANQVDQFGGYTGQTPEVFYNWCKELAKDSGFDEEYLVLGGDHLGPLTWTKLEEGEALKNADQLIYEYVLAGFTKIHIDTSMLISTDDASVPLSDDIIASRTVRLCKKAEEAFEERKKMVPKATPPVYVIGSEVPIPGGAQESEEMEVTDSEHLKTTLKIFHDAFHNNGLAEAWKRIIAVVVQPGVEFSEEEVFVYNRENAKQLCEVIKDDPSLVFEGHSTDYQPKTALHEMIADGICILKVGPALTFAFREALFALENIEKILFEGTDVKLSEFADTLEKVMLDNPARWISHYHGDERSKKINRKYGYSDRARYYLNEEAVKESIERLVANLEDPIPMPLLSQFMPIQYKKIQDGIVENHVDALILDRIGDYYDDYIFALEK